MPKSAKKADFLQQQLLQNALKSLKLPDISSKMEKSSSISSVDSGVDKGTKRKSSNVSKSLGKKRSTKNPMLELANMNSKTHLLSEGLDSNSSQFKNLMNNAKKFNKSLSSESEQNFEFDPLACSTQKPAQERDTNKKTTEGTKKGKSLKLSISKKKENILENLSNNLHNSSGSADSESDSGSSAYNSSPSKSSNEKTKVKQESSSPESDDDQFVKEAPNVKEKFPLLLNDSKSSLQKVPRKTEEVSNTDSEDEESIKLKNRSSRLKLVPESPKKKLAKFISQNPQLKEATIPDNLCVSNDNEHENYYLLQLPKSIDPNILHSANISLENITKLKIDKVKYVIKPTTEESQKVHIVDKTLHPLELRGVLRLERYIKDDSNYEVEVPEKTKMVLPQTKIRHPIFGSKYKRKIKLEREIEEKLKEAVAKSFKKHKKSKKTKVKDEPVEDQNELLIQMLNERFNDNEVKKKRLNASEVEPDVVPKKKKKKKDKEQVIDPIVESTPVVDTSKRRKSLVNSTVLPNTLMSPTFGNDISKITIERTKKKSVKHESVTENALDTDMISKLLADAKSKISLIDDASENKKKRNSVLDESDSSFLKKKKKKDKV